MSMGGMYYTIIWNGSMGNAYYVYHTTLLWLWFVTKGTAGLSFCTRCALLIDEVDKLNHKISEKTQFKVVKAHTDAEQQVENYLLMCCYN